MSVESKKIVIIGADTEIGKATAQFALETGAEVVIAGAPEKVLDSIGEAIGGNVQTCAFDVRDVRKMDHSLAQLSPFDHLVFTLGDISGSSFLETDVKVAREQFDLLFWSQFHAALSAAACLAGGGSITLFSGEVTRKPMAGLSIFAAIFGAIDSMVTTLAVEIAPIRVNAIAPEFVQVKGEDVSRQEPLIVSQAFRCLSHPDMIARSILEIIEDEALSGQVFRIGRT